MKTPVRLLVACQLLKIQAVLLLALGQSRAALARFDRLLALSPLDCHALASRAHIQAQRERFDEAINSLQCLTQIRPQYAAGWFNLGYALQQLGRHMEAGVAFRRALAVDPQIDRAWYGLALVLMDAGLYHAAADALEKTTALQPMSPHGWFRLAQVQHLMGQPAEALKIVQHLRQFEPKVAAQLHQALDLGLHVKSMQEDRDTTAAPNPPAHHAAA